MRLTLAVVVCTRDRPGELAAVLADVAAEGGADEVVVVDQSDHVRPLAGVDHRIDAGRGLPRARNLGWRATRSDIVVFLDDDARLLPGCLEAHRRAYDDPRVGGVAGRIVERTLRPNARRTTNRVDRAGRVRTNLEGGVPCPIETAKGANMSFRREALEAIGGFDEGYAGTAFLEDADASERVAARAWRLVFRPDAAAVHLSSPAGGARVGDPVRTEWWRFHNTGRFLRRNRSWSALPAAGFVFAAIAARRAVEWRRPDGALPLIVALARGWLGGAGR